MDTMYQLTDAGAVRWGTSVVLFFQTWLGNLGPLISGSNLTILSFKVFTLDRKRGVGVFFGDLGDADMVKREFQDWLPKKFFWNDL